MRSSFLGRLFRHCLPRPFPVANFFFVDAFGVSVVDALDDLVLQPFLDVRADGAQARNAIDDVDRQIEAIDLIEDREFERSVDVALFLVSAHMDVVMIRAPVGELVNQRGIGMEVEDDRLVGGEERIEVAIGKPVRMFACPASAGTDRRH